MKIETKTRLLKWAVCLAGLFCIFIFVVVRIKDAAIVLLDPHEYYTGRDLYKESYIDHFREPHPAFDSVTGDSVSYQKSDRHPSIHDADILTFGDSYFNFRLLPTFPELLGKSLNRKVFFRNHHNPFTILEQLSYTGEVSRLLIYEIGERGIYRKFTKSPFLDARRGRPQSDALFQILDPGEAEQRYTALLQLNRLTHRLYKWIATFKFDRFGYISPMTPVYTLNPPFLFFKMTVDDSPYSFFYRHTDEEINTICDNIQLMGAALKERHHLEMIFLPIPSKISVYSELVFGDTPYNDFLPRLYRGLEERNVHVIDLYHPFNASSNTLYFASDTHWNEKGIDLALSTTLDYMRSKGLIETLTGEAKP